MDDKTFIAKYAADEATRINERLKKMIDSTQPLSDAEKESVLSDIEATLARLQSALSHITPEMLAEDYKDHGKPS